MNRPPLQPIQSFKELPPSQMGFHCIKKDGEREFIAGIAVLADGSEYHVYKSIPDGNYYEMAFIPYATDPFYDSEIIRL